MWSTVVFSDESRFEVIPGDTRRRIIRSKDEAFHPDCLERTVKHAASVMVWGCIGRNGTGDCMQSTARSMRRSTKASWHTIFSLFCRDCDPTSMISFNRTAPPAIRQGRRCSGWRTMTWRCCHGHHRALATSIRLRTYSGT